MKKFLDRKITEHAVKRNDLRLEKEKSKLFIESLKGFHDIH
jgi:hypothetical protein